MLGSKLNYKIKQTFWANIIQLSLTSHKLFALDFQFL